MKMIQKLGKDQYYKWAEQFPPDATITMNPEQFFGEVYALGFRKAREILVKYARDYKAMNKYGVEGARDYFIGVTIEDLAQIQEQLGEEEV